MLPCTQVFVPIAVFAICGFFALLLWSFECAEVSAELGGRENVPDKPGMCSYYQWWLYMVGNLVGVGGLTDVGPESGHVAAEIIDLLVAVWSLTVAGLVIGIVGNLAWVNSVTEGADASLSQRFRKMFGQKLRDLAAEGGFDFAKFVQTCEEEGIKLSEERLRQIFAKADKDNDGTIDESEVEALLEVVREEEGSSSNVTDLTNPNINQLIQRMDALEASMEARLDKLTQLLEERAQTA